MGVERGARESAAARYRPRRPSESVLYRCVQEHLETWLAHCRDGHDDDGPVPEYVEREFRRYLECGILAHGFARARCGQCGHDLPVALSCQGRGVCPSCNARRMVATATHLTDHVLPALPVRQWVLAVPKRLRYFLQRDADLQGAALRLLLRAVESCLRAHSPGSGPAARLGAVAFIHRFGSTLNAHLHFHCVVIDGVFDAAPTGGVIFRAVTALAPATAPTPPPEPPAAEPAHRRAARYAWAMLLARIDEVFPLVCPDCGGAMRIIAFITDGPTVRDILAHRGEPTAPPRIAQARGPPLWDLPDARTGECDPHAQPAPEYAFDQRIAW